eukprot:185984-Amphidinium_carterae.1
MSKSTHSIHLALKKNLRELIPGVRSHLDLVENWDLGGWLSGFASCLSFVRVKWHLYESATNCSVWTSSSGPHVGKPYEKPKEWTRL